MTADRIEKNIELKAPIERVWRALTDHEEFSTWFGLTLKDAFVPGKAVIGWNTHIEKEQKLVIQKMDAPHRFSFTWHPWGVDTKVHGEAAHTLIEFTLETIPTGTRLNVVESGFNNLPEHLRAEAIRMHTGGWEAQLKNIKKHVE